MKDCKLQPPRAPIPTLTKPKAAAPEAEDKTRDVSDDGIRFSLTFKKVLFTMSEPSSSGVVTFGDPPSGEIKSFGLVDEAGKVIELELIETNVTDGHIKTKLFGDISVIMTGLQSVGYKATDEQIKKMKDFLSTQAKKPAAPTTK
jgi:hypothetical protein